MTLKWIPALALALSACATARPERALVIDGIGDYSRTIATDEPEAQRWFDQGLLLSYGFNHDEAVRSFDMAASLDPDCAMAWWGKAYALGPNINGPLDEPHAVAAFEAVQEALARKAHASPVERDLIDALAKRYEMPPPAERASLERSLCILIAW